MIILAIDTSSDETAAAVTKGDLILSNVIWSQASLHAKWGGIVPNLAKRLHGERIEWVIRRALRESNSPNLPNLVDAVAVTVGPGLAPALEVGISWAKKLALDWKKPLIPVNHLEGHVLSSLASSNSKLKVQSSKLTYPALALVVSGGHTELVLVEKIGKYKALAQTIDDALGEALDKAARMLGLGYPGGPILEKLARDGDPARYKLPLPLLGRESRGNFSFSGLKTAFYRLVEGKELSRQEICDLAASFQNIAFDHLVRIVRTSIKFSDLLPASRPQPSFLLVGGGVAANVELRKRLRKLGRELDLQVHFPYSKRLCTDNAAMIGLAAQFAYNRGEVAQTPAEINLIDRQPNLNFSS